MKKRLPPYSKRMSSISGSEWGTSVDTRHRTFWVLFGPDSWQKAQQWRSSSRVYLLLPPGDDPVVYDWRRLKEHPPVLLFPCGAVTGGELKSMVIALMQGGTERVLYLGRNGMTLYATPEGVRHAV